MCLISYIAYIRFKDLCDVGMCFELVGEVINIKTQGPLMYKII